MKAIIIVVLVFGLSYVLGQYLKSSEILIASSVSQSSCDLSKTECLIKQGEGYYKIQFLGQPSPLVPFELLLISNNLSINNITVSFDMAGMKMGFNEYSLVNDSDNWSAQVILPVCSLGQTVWRMRVSVKSDASINDVIFTFNQ